MYEYTNKMKLINSFSGISLTNIFGRDRLGRWETNNLKDGGIHGERGFDPQGKQ